MVVVLVQEEQLIYFPTEQPQMTLWVCLLDFPEHTKTQYGYISEQLLWGMILSANDVQIPIIFLHSIVSMHVHLQLIELYLR